MQSKLPMTGLRLALAAGVLLALALALALPGARAQVPFSYPAHVIAEAHRQQDAAEQVWRGCFAQGLAQLAPTPASDWRTVGRVFSACRAQEVRYVRASLTAAQRRFPMPRTDRYGRIVAWDQLDNVARESRRAEWLQIRQEMEFAAMTALEIPSRCEHRFFNYATRGGYICTVPDSEMGYLVFDGENPQP